MDGVARGIDGQRGGVSIGESNLDEAAAGAGGKRELRVGVIQRRGIGGSAGLVQDDGADHAVAEFGAQGGLGGEGDGAEKEEGNEAAAWAGEGRSRAPT